MNLKVVDPTDWCYGMLTCVHDNQSMPYKILPRVFVWKFYHSKEFIPITLQWIYIFLQHVLNDPV